MYELNKSQSKIWVEKYLNPFMEQNEFVLKKTRNSDLIFIKMNSIGQEKLNLGFLNSFPGTQIEYYYKFKINLIEDILNKLLVAISRDEKSSEIYTIGLNQASIDNIRSNSFMPEMVTEEDVKKSCDLVINFLEKTGFPLAERFKDIKEFDKEINGENFWESDWQKPFTLGNDFDTKRVIIAHLANNPKINELIDFHIKERKMKIELGEYIEIHKNGLNKFLNAIEYMKNHCNLLY
ncbi:hypothetical protein MCERE19_01629 [Spirosomataceae bacterium]